MTHSVRVALASAALACTALACGSSHRVRTAPTTIATTVAPVSITTPPTLQVTVPDCGAGAYRPATLLITCAVEGTMATGIQWSTWSSSGASGTGTVHLQVSGQEQTGDANLALGSVADKGTSGPQFTFLTVTWIGRSPDGHASDTFQLGNGS